MTKTGAHQLGVIFCLILEAQCRSVILPPPRPPPPPAVRSKCDAYKNLANASLVRSKEMDVFENCIYYSLVNRAAQATGRSISTTQPLTNSNDDDSPMVVSVHGFSLKTFIRSGSNGAYSRANGIVSLSWMDNRFQWNLDDWAAESFRIKSSSHLWLPEKPEPGFSMHLAASTNRMFTNIRASRLGNISAQMEFDSALKCRSDQSDYPLEILSCCTDISNKEMNPVRLYRPSDHREKVAGVLAGSGSGSGSSSGSGSGLKAPEMWTVRNLELAWRDESLAVCFDIRRSSALIKTELVLPMVASAVFVVLAPLFGSIRAQVGVKMFAVFLQITCFQFLIERTQDAAWFTTVPKIHRFYEITFAITLANLILTLLIMSLSRVRKSFPPPHRIELLARLVNRVMWCTESAGRRGEPTSDGQQKELVKDAEYSGSWSEIFVALNNLASVLLSLIFGLILLVVCY